MDTLIWILKSLVALLFLYVGVNKLKHPKETLLNKGMKGLINLNDNQIKLAGLLEILGVIGLFLPVLLNIYPVLSGVAALCLAFIMIIALMTNLRLKLSIIPNIIILVICLFIAYLDLK